MLFLKLLLSILQFSKHVYYVYIVLAVNSKLVDYVYYSVW